MTESFSRDNKAIETARAVTSFVNNYGCDYKAFAEKICMDHQTLQQSVMRLFVRLCKEMAKKYPGNFDARNEQAVLLAKEIAEISDKYSLPMI